jgi:peptidoglycan/xylan/chitin deacetylase (PgdA/CDA1 family)
VTSLHSLARLAIAPVVRFALRLSGRRAGLVLVFHAVAERHGDPARELVPPHSVALFERQLRHLRAHYRLVRAVELVPAVAGRKRGQRFPIAITFDDDLASHVELAAPILSRSGVPATFFLCGASLDRPFSFWWQRLQRAVDVGLELPPEQAGIHAVASRIESMSPEERSAVADRLGEDLGQDPEDAGLRREQVQELVAAGFDIGFHTLCHDRLPDLGDGALERAMADGRAALEAAAGGPLTMIAYPHGKADERVASTAELAGFRLGFTGRYEPVLVASNPLLLGRIEPSFTSVADFALQLVGALRRPPHR